MPEGMSAERFEWLDRWTSDPSDVIRTPGSESNVKEIYDACAALSADEANVILNQFCEYGNHLGHVTATAGAVERVFEQYTAGHPSARLAGFVAASGSAGTLGAGDPLKERHGSATAVVEALECPTLLYNGYGEHNIQGIGDKARSTHPQRDQHRRGGGGGQIGLPTSWGCCSPLLRGGGCWLDGGWVTT